jgi:hypothetical protein
MNNHKTAAEITDSEGAMQIYLHGNVGSYLNCIFNSWL